MAAPTHLLNRAVIVLCKTAPIYRGKIRGTLLTEALITSIEREGITLDDGSFIYSSNIVSIGPYDSVRIDAAIAEEP
ncbi:hypothetical protein M0R72_17895 [Candidatus Pacearchaeota archaeon]|jgi:hypothetical protein|nr:hypothetical protein [Candidatus Pacearchaeota archaeon]